VLVDLHCSWTQPWEVDDMQGVHIGAVGPAPDHLMPARRDVLEICPATAEQDDDVHRILRQR